MALAYSKAVWNIQAPSPGCKLVMLALADFADEHGVCWPSVRTLASACGMSSRAIQLHLAAITKAGYVARLPHFDSGSQRSNNYQFRPVEVDIHGRHTFSEKAFTPTLKSAPSRRRKKLRPGGEARFVQNLSYEPSSDPAMDPRQQQQQQQQQRQLQQRHSAGPVGPSSSSIELDSDYSVPKLDQIEIERFHWYPEVMSKEEKILYGPQLEQYRAGWSAY